MAAKRTHAKERRQVRSVRLSREAIRELKRLADLQTNGNASEVVENLIMSAKGGQLGLPLEYKPAEFPVNRKQERARKALEPYVVKNGERAATHA